MKRIVFFSFVILSTLVYSQEQTLFTGHVDHGGYGGPVFKYTNIGPNQTAGFLVGGQGGWIIDHKFVIGGGGYGLASSVNADWYEVTNFAGEPEPYVLDFSYGGLLLAFIGNSDNLIHYEIFSILGGGGINYRLKNEINTTSDFGDGIFVAEPGINVMLNVTSFFRVGIGATYRYVQDVDLIGLTNEDLTNFSGQIILKFGAF